MTSQPLRSRNWFGRQDLDGFVHRAWLKAAAVFPMPPGIALLTAAAFPTVLPPAYALVPTVGRLRAGETVLVHSAAADFASVAP